MAKRKKKPLIEFRIGKTGKFKTFKSKADEKKALARFKKLK